MFLETIFRFQGFQKEALHLIEIEANSRRKGEFKFKSENYKGNRNLTD